MELGQTAPDGFPVRLLWLNDQLERIDDQIDDCGPFLCIAAETYFPFNLSVALIEEVWQPRPWWLTEEINDRYFQFEKLDKQFALALAEELVELKPRNFRFNGKDVSSDNYFLAQPVKQSEAAVAFNNKDEISWHQIAEFEYKTNFVEYVISLDVDASKHNWLRTEHPGIEFRFNFVVKESEIKLKSGIYRIRWGNWIHDVDLKTESEFIVASDELQLALHEETCPSIFIRKMMGS